jgi:threonine dehydrogenase-like Zn-dependent dehydrogenase
MRAAVRRDGVVTTRQIADPVPGTGNEAFEAVCSGRPDVTPMAGRVIGLDEVPQALNDARDANGSARIIVVHGR